MRKADLLSPRQPKITSAITDNTDTFTSFHTEQALLEEKQDNFIIKDNNEN